MCFPLYAGKQLKEAVRPKYKYPDFKDLGKSTQRYSTPEEQWPISQTILVSTQIYPGFDFLTHLTNYPDFRPLAEILQVQTPRFCEY